MSRQLDSLLLAPLKSPAARLHRLSASTHLHQVQGFLRQMSSDAAYARFALSCGAGRFASGFTSVLVLSAVVSIVTPLTATAALLVAGTRGAFSWGFPHLEDRYGLVEAVEHRLHSLRNRVPFLGSHAHAAALEDACPFLEADPRRRRHLSLREARGLTETVLGPQPPRSSPDRRTWLTLARLLKKAARGEPAQVWLPGHGAAEAIAELLARHAATKQEDGIRPDFDLRAFGDVVPYATASALRRTVGVDPGMPQDIAPASLSRVPVGRRPALADARVLAAQALGGTTGTPADRAATAATTKLLTRAVRKPHGLRLGFFARRRMASQLRTWTDRTQAEHADLSLWEPRTAKALARAVHRHVQAREQTRLTRHRPVMIDHRSGESQPRQYELAQQRRRDPVARTKDLQRLRRQFPKATAANRAAQKPPRFALHPRTTTAYFYAARASRTTRCLPSPLRQPARPSPAALSRQIFTRLHQNR